MKRTLVVTLGAATLVLAAAAVAFAQDSTATAPSSTPAAPEKHATHHAGKAAAAKHTMVDINSASADDLKKLPGITDEQAEKIVAARPFKSRAELLTKKLVTRAEYRKIRSWVTAKQEAAASK